MNRLVPSRPPLARVRRHVGALPHGLPTALLFTAAVAALMLGSFVVVDRALPVLMRRDADQVRGGLRALHGHATAGRLQGGGCRRRRLRRRHRRIAAPRSDDPSSDRSGSAAAAEVGGRPTVQRWLQRTHGQLPAQRGESEPDGRLGGDGRDRATPEPSPSQPWSLREDDERGPAPTPTATAERPPIPPRPRPRRPPRGPPAGRHRHRSPRAHRHPRVRRRPNLTIEGSAPAERSRGVRPARGDPAS